jgi:hypothetical protein
MKAQRAQKSSSWTTEEQHALLARLLANTQFARSARLRDFLQYVAEHSITNPDTPIREPEIAERIFGRNATHGSDDSIVRVHASQLRKRLEQYFETDGADEELIIEIPKGNYTPVFKRRQVEPLANHPTGDRPPQPSLLRSPWTIAALTLLSIAVILLSWDDLRVRGKAQAPAGTYQKRFWSELLDSPTPCNVVLADSSFGVLRQLSKVDISIDQYANRDYQSMIAALPAVGGLRDWAFMLIHRRFTSTGDSNIARRLAFLAGNHADRLQVMLARDFPSVRLKTENVVLIGSRRSNPWAELVESQLNFQYAFEGTEPETVIRNLEPHAGEQSVYRAEEASGRRIPGGYSVVARLPTVNGKGKVILIAGTESEGTEAGGEFVLNEVSLLQLHQALGARPSEPFPDFEVLLSTTKVSGSSPATRIIGLRRH